MMESVLASIFSLPVSASLPIYTALGLLIIGLILFMLFVIKRVQRIIRRLQRKPVRKVGVTASTLRLLLILLLISASIVLLFFSAFIRSYTAFTQREFVATVHCTPLSGTKDMMTLELMTRASPTVASISRYRLRGQQWTVEGHILKWDDSLNFLGLRTMYKLTRVRGRYLLADDEVGRPATVYSLVANEDTPGWRWLFEYGARLPFVQAVYGNTVFTFPSEAKTFDIYVTISGFMIVERRE